MTTRRAGGREAISHYTVQRKLDIVLREVQPARSTNRYWTDAPDSRAPGFARSSGRGGHAIRRSARAEQQGNWHVTFSCQKFSALGGFAISAPANWRAAIFFGAFARRIGRLSAEAGRVEISPFRLCRLLPLLRASYLLATAGRPRDSRRDAGATNCNISSIFAGFLRLYNRGSMKVRGPILCLGSAWLAVAAFGPDHSARRLAFRAVGGSAANQQTKASG